MQIFDKPKSKSLVPKPKVQVSGSQVQKGKVHFWTQGCHYFVPPPHQPPTHPQLLKGLCDTKWTSEYPKVYLSPYKHSSGSKYRSKGLISNLGWSLSSASLILSAIHQKRYMKTSCGLYSKRRTQHFKINVLFDISTLILKRNKKMISLH